MPQYYVYIPAGVIMTDWFDDTNAQRAFSQNATTRTVLHGQAAMGDPMSENSYIIAASGIRHADAPDFLRHKADDSAWDDICDAFDHLYKNGLVDRGNHIWLTNFTKVGDAGDNDTNSQIQPVHIHVLSGELTAPYEFIRDQRSFFPHPKLDTASAFAENKADMLGVDAGFGFRVVPLPPALKEAQVHTVIMNEAYSSFPDFIERASRDEKRAFWKTVSEVALPLVEQGQGARVGYFNFRGQVDGKMGHMAVEVAGGENLGQNGLKKRWFDNPSPSK